MNNKNEIIGILFTGIDENKIQDIINLKREIFKAENINIDYKYDRGEIIQKQHNSKGFFNT